MLRGTCSFVIKVNNAAAAGAIGVIFVNNSADPTTLTGCCELGEPRSRPT